MIFIVGQTEQASEKAKLLQQIEQVIKKKKLHKIKIINLFSSFLMNKNKILVQMNLIHMMI
jgi:hypothetical protein